MPVDTNNFNDAEATAGVVKTQEKMLLKQTRDEPHVSLLTHQFEDNRCDKEEQPQIKMESVAKKSQVRVVEPSSSK